jgi:hypothetical protein
MTQSVYLCDIIWIDERLRQSCTTLPWTSLSRSLLCGCTRAIAARENDRGDVNGSFHSCRILFPLARRNFWTDDSPSNGIIYRNVQWNALSRESHLLFLIREEDRRARCCLRCLKAFFFVFPIHRDPDVMEADDNRGGMTACLVAEHCNSFNMTLSGRMKVVSFLSGIELMNHGD